MHDCTEMVVMATGCKRWQQFGQDGNFMFMMVLTWRQDVHHNGRPSKTPASHTEWGRDVGNADNASTIATGWRKIEQDGCMMSTMTA